MARLGDREESLPAREVGRTAAACGCARPAFAVTLDACPPIIRDRVRYFFGGFLLRVRRAR